MFLVATDVDAPASGSINGIEVDGPVPVIAIVYQIHELIVWLEVLHDLFRPCDGPKQFLAREAHLFLEPSKVLIVVRLRVLFVEPSVVIAVHEIERKSPFLLRHVSLCYWQRSDFG